MFYRGDVEAAREQYVSLGLAEGSVSLITVARVLGLLAQIMGEPDKAVLHFEDALAFCRNDGYGPELAWTCHDYAQMLLRESAANQEKLTGLLKEALPIATELGMLPLMERVTTLQERADAKPVQAPAYPDGLSAREVEVLRLMRRRQEQPGDRRRAIHQPQYRGAPRKQHS